MLRVSKYMSYIRFLSVRSTSNKRSAEKISRTEERSIRISGGGWEVPRRRARWSALALRRRTEDWILTKPLHLLFLWGARRAGIWEYQYSWPVSRSKEARRGIALSLSLSLFELFSMPPLKASRKSAQMRSVQFKFCQFVHSICSRHKLKDELAWNVRAREVPRRGVRAEGRFSSRTGWERR